MLPRRICLPAADSIRNGRKTLSLCGEWTDARDLTLRRDEATCPECLHADRSDKADMRTAEDVFGTAEDARVFGRPVHAKPFSSTTDYRRREQ